MTESFDTFLKSNEEGLGLSDAFVDLIRDLGINSFERLLSLHDINIDLIVECIGSTNAKRHPQDVKKLACFPRHAWRCVGNNEFLPELFNPPWCFRAYMCKRTRGLNIQLRESINQHLDRPAAGELMRQRIQVNSIPATKNRGTSRSFSCHPRTPDSGEATDSEETDGNKRRIASDTSVPFSGGVNCHIAKRQCRTTIVQQRPTPRSMRWNGKRATFTIFRNGFKGLLIQKGLEYVFDQNFLQAHKECDSDVTIFPEWKDKAGRIIDSEQLISDREFLCGALLSAFRGVEWLPLMRHQSTRDGIMVWIDTLERIEDPIEMLIPRMENKLCEPHDSSADLLEHIEEVETTFATLEHHGNQYSDERKMHRILFNIHSGLGSEMTNQCCRLFGLSFDECCKSLQREELIRQWHEKRIEAERTREQIRRAKMCKMEEKWYKKTLFYRLRDLLGRCEKTSAMTTSRDQPVASETI